MTKLQVVRQEDESRYASVSETLDEAAKALDAANNAVQKLLDEAHDDVAALTTQVWESNEKLVEVRRQERVDLQRAMNNAWHNSGGRPADGWLFTNEEPWRAVAEWFRDTA